MADSPDNGNKPQALIDEAAAPSAWSRASMAMGLGWRRFTASLANLRRGVFRNRLPDYVVLVLDGALTELPPETSWWMRFVPGFSYPGSIASLRGHLRRIAGDPDIAGVLVIIKNLELDRTIAQNLAAQFERFRIWEAEARGPGAPPRPVVVWLEQMSPGAYLAACAVDRLLVAPLATWELIGTRIEAQYYRDALARLGVHAEVVRVAPWKTAADSLTDAAMSDASREQYTWLVDSLFDDMVHTIASGRSLDPERVRQLVDEAPFTAQEALAAGLIDGVCYEDELPALLGSADEPAELKSYHKVRKLFKRYARRRTASRIGVLELSGTIISGESRRTPIPIPFMGGAVLGSSSAEQAVRAARRDDGLAAVVVYVDSPGGSALASDLIERELRLLAQEKPLVVYMGPVAASGGYYLSAPAGQIVAQRGTLTGSIGVVTAKLVTEGAYAKLGIGVDAVQRGEHASIYSDAQPWTESERARIEAGIDVVYTEFKQRVEDGRKLSPEAVDAVAGGRVWTGEQALERGLVDALGDFESAVERAAAMAHLRKGEELRIEYLPTTAYGLLASPAQSVSAWAALALARGSRGAGLADAASLALMLQNNLSLKLLLESAVRRERIWLIADSLPNLHD